MLSALTVAAICLTTPVNGVVVQEYSPIGQYQGHWGVDFAADLGTTVLAPVTGKVTFAGSVAGMRSITIEPLPGYKVSMSYLGHVRVETGRTVSRGDPVGSSGAPHGVPGVHLSVRLDGRYVDPQQHMGCMGTDITRALRLMPPPTPYPRRRAHRNTGRDLRSNPQRPSRRRQGGIGPVEIGPGADHARR